MTSKLSLQKTPEKVFHTTIRVIQNRFFRVVGNFLDVRSIAISSVQFKNGFIWSFHHLHKVNIIEKMINIHSCLIRCWAHAPFTAYTDDLITHVNILKFIIHNRTVIHNKLPGSNTMVNTLIAYLNFLLKEKFIVTSHGDIVATKE